MTTGVLRPQAAAGVLASRSAGPLFAPFRRAGPSPRTGRLAPAASKGFDSQQKAAAPKSKEKRTKLDRYLELDEKQAGSGGSAGDGWTRVASLSNDFLSKPIKAVILATGQAICVYKVGDRLFCSAANSTAYQYPLADANILQTKQGPAVEVPLDGTTYLLETGKVISWCPKNTFVRKVLGSLKDGSQPVDLQVYPVEARGDDIYVCFA